MRFEIAHRLPGEPTAVFALLRQEEFQAAMDARLGLDKRLLENGGDPSMRRWWVIERGERPAFVTRVLGPVFAYTLEHRVDAETRTLKWKVIPAVGADRVRAEGYERIEGAAEGSRRLVGGSVEVRVPVVGRKLADYIGSEVEAGFRGAVPFIESWVRDRLGMG